MSLPAQIAERFPGAVDETLFVAEATVALHRAGFSADNTLVAVSVCRDELCRSLVGRLEGLWGPVFDLSGLAGLPSGGVTSMVAALSRRPHLGDRSNVVVFAMSHVGVADDGTLGQVRRPGMAEATPTCGSLAVVADALARGGARSELVADDHEQVRVEQRIGEKLGERAVPDLADLADLALACIEDDIDLIFERLAQQAGNERRRQGTIGMDGAVFTGVQLHQHPSHTMIWPQRAVIEVGGELRSGRLVQPS